MRFVSYLHDGVPALGARVGEEVINLSAGGLPDNLEAFLRGGSSSLDAAKAVIASSAERIPVEGLSYLAPLRQPSKAIAVGLNYVDHAAESNLPIPAYPVLFNRYPSSWVGHGKALVASPLSKAFDFEAELVVVIGTGGRAIEKSRALNHVAGYSIFNEGTMRDFQFKSSQWLAGKNFDRSGGFGPEFVTADELPAGGSGLRVQTRLNGETLQDGNTSKMIFDVATLISVCSEIFTLQPGDFLMTGTPAGVGMARKPPVFMKAGDVCEVEIEGIGILRNPVISL